MNCKYGRAGEGGKPGACVVTQRNDNDPVNEQHIDDVEYDINEVIAECVEPAPVVVQSVSEKQELPPPGADGHGIIQRMDIHQSRVLQHDLLVVEDKIPMQTVGINDHGHNSEHHEMHR